MDKNQAKEISQKRLVRIFKDIKKCDSAEQRFCFLIGAGASKSSGIPTGWELSADWYKDLKEDLSEKERIEWEQEIDFDEKRIGEFYSFLYKKRYEISPQLGYEEFKKLMESIEPGLGYVILSQILANEKHNFVITTNFDYLIEDAVRMYTSTKPFSAGHETLAEFISSQTERPTIIKVHRDLFLHPFNDKAETDKLKEEWERALKPILKNFSLLVIGYGGNDGSLMDYLSNINPEDRKPIYWCTQDKKYLNSKIDKLLTKKDFVVEIDGFDELMFALDIALEYKVFESLDITKNHPFVKAAEKRILSLNEKRKELFDEKKDKEDVAEETKSVFTGAMKVMWDAYSEKDINKKEEMYKKGLVDYPNDANLIGDYAVFLSDIRKNYDKAEEYYQKAIGLDLKHVINIGNYALFLSDIRKEYDKAEEYYQRSIELDPKHANSIGNYAVFLSNIRKNYAQAEEYYQKAIELDPKHANSIGNYAVFLSNIRKNYNKAEEYYQKAIVLDSKHVINIGNYALFLSNIRKEYDKAEEYYQRAIELAPEGELVIGNYANFLFYIRKNYAQAEEYYQKAIELDPKQANSIGNYAVLLSNIRKNYDKAEEYYQKAIELDPKYVNSIGSYANFLSDIRKDYDKAEEYYQKAIELDSKHANNIANYAHYLIISQQDFEKAETYIDKAFELADDSYLGLLAELWFYRYAHYSKWESIGEEKLNQLVEKGAKSIGWNLQSHIDIAKDNKTSDIKKLERFAKLITEE